MFDFNKNIYEALNLSIDDIDDKIDDKIEDMQMKKGKIENINGKKLYQQAIGNKIITKNIFIHELTKRLPGINRKSFLKFNFVNYKVTGDEYEWPYIFYTYKQPSHANALALETMFKNGEWITKDDEEFFRDLLLIDEESFPAAWTHVPNIVKGNKRRQQFIRKYENSIEDKCSGKYNEYVEILKNLSKDNPILKSCVILYVDQISISNDGAFYMVRYHYLAPRNYDSIYKIEIHCTEDIIGKQGIDIDEAKKTSVKIRQFKSFLKKNIVLFSTDFPKKFLPTIIDNHVALYYMTTGTKEYAYLSDTHYRPAAAQNLFIEVDGYHNINEINFMRYALYSSLYVDKREIDIYEKLSYLNNSPYIVMTSKDGKYIMTFYSCKKHFYDKSVTLVFAVIDNRDYGIIPKSYIDDIQYNYSFTPNN